MKELLSYAYTPLSPPFFCSFFSLFLFFLVKEKITSFYEGWHADARFNIGIKAKVENKNQYQQYLDELKPLREELGVELKEDLYPEEK